MGSSWFGSLVVLSFGIAFLAVLGSFWSRFGVVLGCSGGRFGAFSAFQLCDSTHQPINSSIQPINSSTHRFNSSTHQLIDSTHQPINSIPKVDELSTTRPGGLRAARLNPPPGPEGRDERRVRLWMQRRPSPSCRILFVLFSIVFVLIGPLKPEVEEEVAEHALCLSLGHFSPPLFSPQEANAVRRATPKSALTPS